MRLPALTLLAACAGAAIPAARFAPRADWTYTLGAPVAPPRSVDRDAMIDDIAYLEHALDEAWPTQVAPTPEFAKLLRDRARELPRRGELAIADFCRELAEAYRSAQFSVTLAGQRCGDSRVRPAPPIRPAFTGNFAWRRDGAVGVLAIQHFAPPDDAGWSGFADVLAEVATTGVVVLDLQAADGDDPRAGFAVLSALGLDTFERNQPRPMVARDTPMAAVVRANHHALHPESTSRPRVLWQTFATQTAILDAGRAAFPIKRTTPLIKTAVVVGSGCERACQLISSLAEFQARVDVASTTGAEDKLGGDELGTIRLPHSGLEVTFPTVAYGTAWGGFVLGSHVAGADLVAGEIKSLATIAAQRASQDRWETTPLPDCRELAADDVELRHKRSGCFTDKSNGVGIILALGSERTREFLTSCGLSIGSTITNPIEGITIATATGSHEALQRLAHAEFVKTIEWSCPMYPN